MLDRRSQESARTRLGRFLPALLLTFVSIVTARRAALLVSGSSALDGWGERRFYGWAYRDPRIGPLLESVARNLAPGEIVRLVSPPPRLGDPGWLEVMGAYYLPRQEVLRADAHARAPGVWVTTVVLEPGGGARIARRSVADGGR